jgi:hypothetical protein
MRKLESVSSNTSAADKYAGYYIFPKDNESIYKFLRRIIVEIILQVNSQLTVNELCRDLEELTDIKINMPFLLATLIFKDSGIVIEGDIISASITDSKLSKNILKVAKRTLDQMGGAMEKEELFHCIRKNTLRPLSDATLSASLHKRTNLKCKEKGGKIIISLKK